jgi:hypothetical protein
LKDCIFILGERLKFIWMENSLVLMEVSQKTANLKKPIPQTMMATDPLKITPKDLHTLAIRFSNHQAKKNHQIFRYFSENLGFNIGFSTAIRGKFSDLRYAHSFATLAVISVVLSLLLLTLPEDFVLENKKAEL